jgi:hypothetical protein
VSRSVDHAPPQRGRIALASRRRVPSPGRLVIRRGDEVHDGVEASRRAWCDCDVQPAEMQRNGGYWNQDSGAIDKVVSELLAALAAQEARSGLSRLAEKLAGLRARDAQPRAVTSRRLRPHRPGWVLDAVRAVMADQVGPMRVAHVHAAVEAALGEAVSANSVSWVLVSHSAGPSPLFVRVARGRYVLASADGDWASVQARPKKESPLSGARAPLSPIGFVALLDGLTLGS